MRGHVQPHVPQRGVRASQPQVKICRQTDLRKEGKALAVRDHLDLNRANHEPDLLWPLLRGREPLPSVSHLYRDGHQDVHQQEEERVAAAHLCHRRRSLPEHAYA